MILKYIQYIIKENQLLLKDLLEIYKYMTAISKNVYVDKLDDILNEYNNRYHRTIKVRPVDVKDNTYIASEKEVNDKNPKFKVGDYVKISKYKNIFAKGCNPNWSEEGFVIKEIKITVPWTYVINDLNSQEIIGTFYEKRTAKDKSTRIKDGKSNQEKKIIHYMSNGKVMIIRLIAGLIKKT